MNRRALLWIAVVLPLAACDDHSMTQQNRYVTYALAGLFPDNTEAQPLPAPTADWIGIQNLHLNHAPA